jgi:hypothetical protein
MKLIDLDGMNGKSFMLLLNVWLSKAQNLQNSQKHINVPEISLPCSNSLLLAPNLR